MKLAIAAALAIALAGCPQKGTRAGGGGTGAGSGDPVDVEVGVDETQKKQLAVIESAINAHGVATHTCWSMAAADDYRVAGRVLLRLTFGGGGQVATVAVEGDTVEDPVLIECLSEMWKASQWPAELFAAGDQIRLPPFEFVAPEGQYVVNARHAVLYEIGADKKSGASLLIDYKNSGNSAGALTLLTLKPGFKAPLHQHTSAEVLYVLSGTGTLSGHRRSGKPETVSAGTAIYIPAGAPHAFDAGAEPVVVLQLYAPGGPEQRFKGVDVGGTEPVKKRGRRDPEVKTRSHAQVKSYTVAGGKGTASLLFDAESAPDNVSSVGGLTLQGKTAIPQHIHANSTEILFIIEGGGIMTVAGEAREVGRLDAIQIPPGVDHAFVAGDETVKAIQFYTPSGPEQRFKK